MDWDTEQVEEVRWEMLTSRKLLKARGTQRDSTHVLAAIRDLNRLEMVGDTLRHALEMLATGAHQQDPARSP
jgi:hypothetical protein